MKDWKTWYPHEYLDKEFTDEYIESLVDSQLISPTSINNKSIDIDVTEYESFPNYIEGEENTEFWTELTDVAFKVYLSRNCDSFDDNSLCDWDELGHDKLIKGKRYSSDFIKEKMGVNTPLEGAALVRADFPTVILSDLAEWLYSRGAKPRDIFRRKGYSRFTNGPVLLGRILGEAVHRVSPNCFAAKYHFKRPRPEQEIGRWARGEIKAPKWADQLLHQYVDEEAVKADQRTFTTYPEGSPKFHFSMPAMHASVGAIAVIFKTWFELDEQLADDVTRTAFNVAIFRDFAGVHYRSDDLLGLEIGERVMAKQIVEIILKASADHTELDLELDANQLREIAENNRTHWLE